MQTSGNCSAGLCLPVVSKLPEALEMVCSQGYDFLVSPLVHPKYKIPEIVHEPQTISEKHWTPTMEKRKKGAFTRSDLLLSSSDWTTLFVGVMSRDINCESSISVIRRRSEERLLRELAYASHLGLSAIMIHLKQKYQHNLARIMYGFMLKNVTMQIWVRVPLFLAQSCYEPWAWWDSFRGAANHERRLYLALEIPSDIYKDTHALDRWIGEPVKALILNTSLFLTNKKGYPVLPRHVQNLLRAFYPLDAQVILEGRPRGHEYRLYHQYLDHLWQQFSAARSGDPLNNFAKGYEDYLQTPLQPLSDNLESGTYEVFEKDPVKYTEYQKATYLAIMDKIPEEEIETKTIVVMVLGAGRGPLVRAALKAANLANRKIRVFAVEKNPNAIVTLMTQKEEEWGDLVQVISSDMRDWKPNPEDKADIVISELLGSFGDNELSPECLYSAEVVLKNDAISIPTSYTSFIAPLQSSKIFNEVRNSVDRNKNPYANFETPYVVHFQNRTVISSPQPLFTFDHPSKGPIDNNRYKELTFNIELDCQLHGFGGYFECNLYKDVNISINPTSHSPGMFSWFPIFFPLSTPYKLSTGNTVRLNFWRLNDGKNVWYEWGISEPVASPIHNPNGRSYTIGLK